MSMIYDGTGTGRRAKVNTHNQLEVQAETETVYREAVKDSRAFNINSFDGTLSAITGEQAVLYIKNESTETLELVNLFGGFWNFTAGTDDTFRVKIYQNPTGGTLLSEAQEVTVVNRSAGAIDTFATDITVYEASAGGKTFGSTPTSPNAFLIQGNGRLFASIDLNIPPGQAYGIAIDTDGGSADYYIGFAGYITETV